MSGAGLSTLGPPEPCRSAATCAPPPWTAVTLSNRAVRHRASRHGRAWADSTDRRKAAAPDLSFNLTQVRHVTRDDQTLLHFCLTPAVGGRATAPAAPTGGCRPGPGPGRGTARPHGGGPARPRPRPPHARTTAPG